MNPDFDFYDTEACQQSAVYDGAEYYAESYTIEDRKDYIDAKGRCFKKEDIGKYVIVQNSRHNKKVMPIMYLVDRRITKRWWWSPDSHYAMIFDDKSSAERMLSKYKYNKVRYIKIQSWRAEQEWFNKCYGEE
jgi:hypothetical protein